MSGNYYLDKIQKLESDLRSEKGAKAGYKSVMAKLKKEKEQNELLLYYALLEIKRLKKEIEKRKGE